jgi:hypothetical protein
MGLTRAPYFNYMEQKFMITNATTFDYAKELYPQRLDIEVGNPDNINDEYVRKVMVFGRGQCGKTALIDQIRCGKMENSPNSPHTEVFIGNKRFSLMELSDNFHQYDEQELRGAHIGIILIST